MSLGPIPISAFESYFRMFGVHDLDDKQEILNIVSEVDSYYLKKQSTPKKEVQSKKENIKPERK